MITRLFAFVVAGSLLAACVQNEVTLEPRAVCSPGDSASNCSPSGGTCDRFLTGYAWMFLQIDDGGGGTYDNGMWFYMEVANNRPSNEGEGGQLDSANAHITDYVLSYESEGLSIPSYTFSTVTVTVPAEGSATPFVPLIPEEMSALLQGIIPAGETRLVDVYVAFKGHYLDQSEFETAGFKVATYVTNAVFPGYPCPNVGDVVSEVCPNYGQTAAYTCSTP
jgi:hypothetical protein